MICFAEQVLVNWGMKCHEWLKKHDSKATAKRIARLSHGKQVSPEVSPNKTSSRELCERRTSDSQDRSFAVHGSIGPAASPESKPTRRHKYLSRIAIRRDSKKQLAVGERKPTFRDRWEYPTLKFIARFRFGDYWMRVLLPVTYISVTLSFLMELNFGRDHGHLLQSSPFCT